MVVSLTISSLNNHSLSTFPVSGAVLGPGQNVEEGVLAAPRARIWSRKLRETHALCPVYLRVLAVYNERTWHLP